MIWLNKSLVISGMVKAGLKRSSTSEQIIQVMEIAEMPPAPPVQKTMLTLARLGLVSIVLLWATGIPLTFKVYGTFDLGWPFHLKMFGATTLLAAVAFLNMHLTQQSKAGRSPNPSVMNIIPPIARTSLALVLIGVAVLTTPF
jgi:hypothetical protein